MSAPLLSCLLMLLPVCLAVRCMLRISKIFSPLDPNRRPESENSAPGPRSQQSGPKWPKTTSKGCPKQHNMTPHLPWAKTSRVMLDRRVSRYKTWLHERTPALQRLMPLTASCHCPKWAYTCHQLTTLILPDESETSHTESSTYLLQTRWVRSGRMEPAKLDEHSAHSKIRWPRNRVRTRVRLIQP